MFLLPDPANSPTLSVPLTKRQTTNSNNNTPKKKMNFNTSLFLFASLLSFVAGSEHGYCNCNLNVTSPCTCYAPGSASIDENDPAFTGTSGDYSVKPTESQTVYAACNDTNAYAMSVKLSDTKHFSCSGGVDGQQYKFNCENDDPFNSHSFHFDSFVCAKYVVKGYWVEKIMIIADTDYQIEYGASKSVTQTESDTWNDSVTNSVSSGFTAEGASVSATTSETVGTSVSETDSTYWSMSQTDTYTTHYDSSDAGKVVWQWQYSIKDIYGNSVIAMTEWLALTNDPTVTPKCIGGYAMDTGAYQVCEDGYYLPGEDPNSSTATRKRYLRSNQR